MERRRIDGLARALAGLRDRRETLAAGSIVSLAVFLVGEGALARKKAGKGDDRGAKGNNGTGKPGKRTKSRGNTNKIATRSKKRRRRQNGKTARPCNGAPLKPGADLRGCDLRARTDFAGANLTDADLSDADLRGVDATGASLRGARLWRAKLSGATLAGANFAPSAARKTDLFGVDFTNANLGRARGLDRALYVFRPEAPRASWYVTFCNTTLPDGSVNDDNC